MNNRREKQSNNNKNDDSQEVTCLTHIIPHGIISFIKNANEIKTPVVITIEVYHFYDYWRTGVSYENSFQIAMARKYFEDRLCPSIIA